MASLLVFPILRSVQYRLCIPHVFPHPALSTTGRGRFSRQTELFRLDDRLRRDLHLSFGSVVIEEPSIFGLGLDVYDDICLGKEERRCSNGNVWCHYLHRALPAMGDGSIQFLVWKFGEDEPHWHIRGPHLLRIGIHLSGPRGG